MRIILDALTFLSFFVSEIILMFSETQDKQELLFIRSPLHYVNSEGILYKPTILTDHEFSAGKYADRIRNAKKDGDEKVKVLKETLTSRTNRERQKIMEVYLNKFKKSLADEIIGVNPEQLKLLLKDLLTNLPILIADELFAALSSADLKTLTSHLIDFWGNEFSYVEKAYKTNYKESFWKRVENKFGNSVRNLLACVVDTRRTEVKQDSPIKGRGGKPMVVYASTVKLFNQLKGIINQQNDDAGQQLSQLFCHTDPFQLELVTKLYNETHDKHVKEYILQETSGGLRDVLTEIYDYSVDKPMYFASIFHNELNKTKPNELKIQRLLILRSEIDLHSINESYKRMYGVSLSNDIKQKFTDQYGEALQSILMKREISNIFQHSIEILI
uniref:Annexin n=2 Tax=Trichobilharzia regenti TaxID=157069 RepID=A0AA85IZE0_TRIRE|nr:unnamed protein product [Trichobilharzia regenti]